MESLYIPQPTYSTQDFSKFSLSHIHAQRTQTQYIPNKEASSLKYVSVSFKY